MFDLFLSSVEVQEQIAQYLSTPIWSQNFLQQTEQF